MRQKTYVRYFSVPIMFLKGIKKGVVYLLLKNNFKNL